MDEYPQAKCLDGSPVQLLHCLPNPQLTLPKSATDQALTLLLHYHKCARKYKIERE